MLDNLPFIPLLILLAVSSAITPLLRRVHWLLVVFALAIITYVGAFLIAPDILPKILSISTGDVKFVLKNWLDKIFPGGA